MPKVSVYLPDELYRLARERGLPLSKLTQAAVRAELEEAPNAAWVERARRRPPRPVTDVDMTALLDGVREEFGR